MNELINEKYKPRTLDDFDLNISKKKLIKFFFNKNDIKFLIIGNTCSGKTIFANILINEYFEFDNNLKKK